MSSVTGEDIEVAARGWIGTPFQHQQRARGVACDCAGLLIGVARELALVAPDFDVSGYASRPDGRQLQAYCEQFMQRISRNDMRVGDAVLIAWMQGLPQHLGIVVAYPHGGLSMLHAESRRHREVIETRLMFGSVMRFVAAYRLPGVA